MPVPRPLRPVDAYAITITPRLPLCHNGLRPVECQATTVTYRRRLGYNDYVIDA